MVIAKMEEMYKSSFQDMLELSQATQFLHENGIVNLYLVIQKKLKTLNCFGKLCSCAIVHLEMGGGVMR